MPIWPAFNQYPDTHRVWDGGWCGHIILMGLLTDSVESDVPRAQLKTLPGALLPLPAALDGAGVRHVLKVGPANKALATFPDEQPALVQVPVGQGAV
jgi:hypothetical protein